MSAAEAYIPQTEFERLREGREIIRTEAEALENLAKRLDGRFCAAVEMIATCSGSVIVTGMGKAGLIGQKIAATLSSTGTRAHFMHPAEAVHGDLGCLHDQDLVVALSNSGETEELLQIMPSIVRRGVDVIAVTSTDRNALASFAKVTIELGRMREACAWGLAPSTSTTAMLAVGDALALVVSRIRGFTPENFAAFHPAGSLGRRFKPVTELMRPREQLRIAHDARIVRDVLTACSRDGRRTGAVILVNGEGRLSGLFTDSDLARLLEGRRDGALDQPICQVMTRRPKAVPSSSLITDIVDLLREEKISELPVVDDDERPVGLIDITDVIGWMPSQTGE